MPAGSSVRYSNGSPAAVMKALIAGAREGVEEGARYWDREFLPDHFAPSAAQKYNYAPRSGENESAMVYSNEGREVVRKGAVKRLRPNQKFFWSKKRRGRGTTPLIFTGNLRDAALSGASIRSRRSGNTITGSAVLSLPKYAYQINPNGQRIDKANELTRAIESEIAVLSQVIERTMARRADMAR